MMDIASVSPHIRIAHHYRFRWERNADESARIGYCYAFHLISGGRGTVTYRDRTHPVRKGDLVFIPPREKHAISTDADHLLSASNIYFELWAVAPLPTDQHLVWKASNFNEALATPVHSCREVERLPVVLPLQRNAELSQLFSAAVAHSRKDGTYAKPVANSLLKAFFLDLLQSAPTRCRTDHRIQAMLDRIHKESFAYSDYEAWANESGLHKTRFHELFKQSTGLSPKAYWTKTMMAQAEAALCESHRSISDIAEDLGYSSIHHFTRLFTATHGMSPTAYRHRRS